MTPPRNQPTYKDDFHQAMKHIHGLVERKQTVFTQDVTQAIRACKQTQTISDVMTALEPIFAMRLLRIDEGGWAKLATEALIAKDRIEGRPLPQ